MNHIGVQKIILYQLTLAPWLREISHMINESKTETNFIKAFIDSKNKGTTVTNCVMPGIYICATG